MNINQFIYINSNKTKKRLIDKNIKWISNIFEQ